MDKSGLIPFELKKIINDNKSGSSQLHRKLNLFFLARINDFPGTKKFIPQLKKQFADFAGITNFLSQLEKFSKPEEASKFLKANLENESSAFEDLYNKISPLLKKCKMILTLSNSRTVAGVLKLHKTSGNKFSVIIAESRPKMEGRIMARTLAKEGIKAGFITDAMLPSFIEGCGCVLIGADKILKNGNVVNKTGSRNAALLCKQFNKPFYVVADKSKVSKDTKYKENEKPAAEVWGTKDLMIKVHNYYFEEVERKLITKLIIGNKG